MEIFLPHFYTARVFHETWDFKLAVLLLTVIKLIVLLEMIAVWNPVEDREGNFYT